MKIGKAISIELSDGQRLSLSLKETKELYLKLGKMLTDGSTRRRQENAGRKMGRKSSRKTRGTTSTKSSSPSRMIVSLSDAKKQEILAHLNKEISGTPRTLSNLLKGVSFSASQLPMIRSIVEGQQNIRAKSKGKRTLYLRKKTTRASARKAANATTEGKAAEATAATATA